MSPKSAPIPAARPPRPAMSQAIDGDRGMSATTAGLFGPGRNRSDPERGSPRALDHVDDDAARRAAGAGARRVKTTFGAEQDHLDWMDAQAKAIHRGGGYFLRRSELLSHILAGLVAAGLDVSTARSGEEVEALVRERLGPTTRRHDT